MSMTVMERQRLAKEAADSLLSKWSMPSVWEERSTRLTGGMMKATGRGAADIETWGGRPAIWDPRLKLAG